MLVDDAHLLAGPVLQRILMLAERCEALDLRIVVAHRPVQPEAELAALDAARSARGALHLGPLAATSIDADVSVDRRLAGAGRGRRRRGARRLVAARIPLLSDEDQAALRGSRHAVERNGGRGQSASSTTGRPGSRRRRGRPCRHPARGAGTDRHRRGVGTARRARRGRPPSRRSGRSLAGGGDHLRAGRRRVRTTGPAIAAELYEAAIPPAVLQPTCTAGGSAWSWRRGVPRRRWRWPVSGRATTPFGVRPVPGGHTSAGPTSPPTVTSPPGSTRSPCRRSSPPGASTRAHRPQRRGLRRWRSGSPAGRWCPRLGIRRWRRGRRPARARGPACRGGGRREPLARLTPRPGGVAGGARSGR